MNGVAIVRYLLSTNSNLIAAVPAAKIKAGTLPIDIVLPAISVTQIFGSEHTDVAMNSANVLATNRVQVTVLAEDNGTQSGYALKKSILALVRKACPNTHGTVNGFTVDSILPDIVGPDIDIGDPMIYTQSRDFIVRFSEAT
jgi:hypothetical protein